MNTAKIKMLENERKKDKYQSYLVAAIGWLAVGIGGIIGAGLFYAFSFIFLSIGV